MERWVSERAGGRDVMGSTVRGRGDRFTKGYISTFECDCEARRS